MLWTPFTLWTWRKSLNVRGNGWQCLLTSIMWVSSTSETKSHCFHVSGTRLAASINNWRVQWKKGVRIFTQNWTLSETLQTQFCLHGSNNVLHVFSLKFASFLRYSVCEKTHFSKAILWGPFVERKQKKPFVSLKHGVSIIQESLLLLR